MVSVFVSVLARRAPRSFPAALPRAARALSSTAASTAASTSSSATPTRTVPSAKAVAVAAHDAAYNESQAHLEGEKTEIQKYREELNAIDPYAVFAVSTPLPDPVLPDDRSEVSALDPSHKNQVPLNPDGSEKVVVIKQNQAKWPGQAPLGKEAAWVISFQDNGETAETWTNPLMGWTSGADPLAANMRLQMSFETAADAKYFAEKRGWRFRIEPPIIRKGRDDNAQYQDVYLPQSVAGKIKREGHKCNHWYRDAAGASHYARPLTFHGDGVVRQHGANQEKPTDKDAESYYKMR